MSWSSLAGERVSKRLRKRVLDVDSVEEEDGASFGMLEVDMAEGEKS
jgi:hypothetical protein